MKKGLLIIVLAFITGAVVAQPVCSFTSSDTAGCAPLFVTFSDQSTGTISNRFFDFGDNTSATTGVNTSHYYDRNGYYLVTHIVQDINGLADTCYQTIHVGGLEVIGKDWYLCPNQCVNVADSIIINNTISPFYGFAWYDSNFSFITGGGNPLFGFEVCYESSLVTYMLQVFDSTCVSPATVTINWSNNYCPVGVSTLSDDSDITITPNPATSLLSIQTSPLTPEGGTGSPYGGWRAISIFDISGRKVMEEKYTPQVDISALQAGGYFIELRNEETVVRKRWVKVN